MRCYDFDGSISGQLGMILLLVDFKNNITMAPNKLKAEDK